MTHRWVHQALQLHSRLVADRQGAIGEKFYFVLFRGCSQLRQLSTSVDVVPRVHVWLARAQSCDDDCLTLVSLVSRHMLVSKGSAVVQGVRVVTHARHTGHDSGSPDPWAPLPTALLVVEPGLVVPPVAG